MTSRSLATLSLCALSIFVGSTALALADDAKSAAPAKITAAQALAAASDWHAKMIVEDDAKSRAEAMALTSTTFFSAAYDETGESVCQTSIARTPAAIAKALDCLQKQLPASAELTAWTKKDGKALKGPLGAQQRKHLLSLEKKAVLVHQHVACVGEGSDLILAVALEGPAGKQVPAVVAVATQKLVCGE